MSMPAMGHKQTYSQDQLFLVSNVPFRPEAVIVDTDSALLSLSKCALTDR
jgi:hypothetical protein